MSQWQAYRNSGNGIALGFNGPLLKGVTRNRRMSLWKCIYDDTLQMQIAEDLVDLILDSYDTITKPEEDKKFILGYFNGTFLRVAPILKNIHFRHEQEWRLITEPIKSTNENFHARFSNSRVAPYYALDFNLLDRGKFEFIEEIVTGPTREPDLVGRAFRVLLDDFGYKVE